MPSLSAHKTDVPHHANPNPVDVPGRSIHKNRHTIPYQPQRQAQANLTTLSIPDRPVLALPCRIGHPVPCRIGHPVPTRPQATSLSKPIPSTLTGQARTDPFNPDFPGRAQPNQTAKPYLPLAQHFPLDREAKFAYICSRQSTFIQNTPNRLHLNRLRTYTDWIPCASTASGSFFCTHPRKENSLCRTRQPRHQQQRLTAVRTASGYWGTPAKPHRHPVRMKAGRLSQRHWQYYSHPTWRCLHPRPVR